MIPCHLVRETVAFGKICWLDHQDSLGTRAYMQLCGICVFVWLRQLLRVSKEEQYRNVFNMTIRMFGSNGFGKFTNQSCANIGEY